MNILCNFNTQQLIDELHDRGAGLFLSNEEVDDVNETIEGGNMLVDLISALRSARILNDSVLQIKLIDALIFATVEEGDVDDIEKHAA
jgi:hypothetical protein